MPIRRPGDGTHYQEGRRHEKAVSDQAEILGERLGRRAKE